MKRALLMTLLAGLLSPCGSAMSATCKSKCEEVFGKGDARCSHICEGMDDKPRRVSKAMTAKDGAEARAAFEAGATQGAVARAAKASEPAASAASAASTK